MGQPRSLNSTKPFVSTAREYTQKGWDVLPLPRHKKEHPPVGYSGRAGKFADDDDLTNWLCDVRFSEGNIALRLGRMIVIDGSKYEVIGIDVDAHSGKKGAQELSKLEDKLGRLGDTWISSSRSDGVSGIRFYLVPYGYGFRGKASDSIDIVQRVHRYAVCYPSWHPDIKCQYFWYPPGKSPDGQGFSLDIPDSSQLPLLSDEWIDHLTAGRMQDSSFGDGDYGIDLDISEKDLFAWATSNFNAGPKCSIIEKAVAKHIEKITQSTSGHDKLTNSHWHLLHLCCEGHTGWKDAVDEINAVWSKDVQEKDKRRDATTIIKEIRRSFIGTMRKLKAKSDSWREQGISLFSPECCQEVYKAPPVTVNGGIPPHWIDSVPIEKDCDANDFDCNDVSQAWHFRARVGDNVRYLADYNAWLIYDGKHWHIDDFNLVRALFDRACVMPSKMRALQKQKALAEHISKGGTDTDNIGGPLKRSAAKLFKVSDTYRSDAKIRAMLNCMKSLDVQPTVSMKYSELNRDSTILAMPSGKCIKLDEPGKPNPKGLGFTIVDNKKEYYTTFTTAVDYQEWQDISYEEKKLWREYLDLFLPDREYRRFVQKALGHILFGGNSEKFAIFLVGQPHTGKSTMVHCIRQTLNENSGGYGSTFQPNSVFKDSSTGTNPELGNLLYKRVVTSSESGSQRIYANPFKRHTGGDQISVTRKYANDQIQGIPHFTMLVATNNPPTIDDADEATVKRIMVCPFDVVVQPKNDDKSADSWMPRKTRHAVFHWLLEGYRRYIHEGLDWENWHDKAKAATLEFASELSDVATFLNEIVEAAPADIKAELARDAISPEHEALRKEWSKITQSALHQAYLQEMTEGQKPLSSRAFSKKVRQMFSVNAIPMRRDGKIIKVYLGLKWKNESAMSQLKG